MGIYRQHSQIEGLVLLRDAGELTFGNIEKFFILKAPPDLIAGRNGTFFHGGVIVVDLVVPMLGEILPPPAKGGIGAAEELLIVAILIQDLSHGL